MHGRVRTARRHGGLGLGLAIVRHIVEVHGGTVSADSAGAGQGATFTVEIPISAESGRHDGASNDETDGAPRPLRGVRVLVVDDEADARELMKVILEQAGARVVAVDSAAAALTAVDTVHPAVLISDIAMPGDDGYTLLGTCEGAASTSPPSR
jgi:PleD family two-component response regulator